MNPFGSLPAFSYDEFQKNVGNLVYPNGIQPDGMTQEQMFRQGIGQLGAGMLANNTRNPMQALGMSYLEAQNQGLNNARQTMVAKEFKAQEEDRKSQREQREQMLRERSRIAQMISSGQPQQGGTGGDLNALYEAYSQAQMIGDEDLAQSIKARIDQQQSGIDNEMDRERLGVEKAKLAWEQGGKLEADVAKDTASWYLKEGMAQDKAAVDAIKTVRQAKQLIPNIQTGAFAEKIQALRSVGAALGVDVDEKVLSDTQAYQNFIKNVVIPRLKQVGGNDSNEEMRKLEQASGGDITQSADALALTLDYFEKLTYESFQSNKFARDVMQQVSPSYRPLEIEEYKPTRRSKVVKEGW